MYAAKERIHLLQNASAETINHFLVGFVLPNKHCLHKVATKLSDIVDLMLNFLGAASMVARITTR